MDKILQGLSFDVIYLDDILIHSADASQHADHLSQTTLSWTNTQRKYGTARIQVYNRTCVLAQDSKQSRDFCRVHKLCTSSKMHAKIFTARQQYSSIETRISQVSNNSW